MSKKINVLFYADCLISGLKKNAFRAGVFFVVLNLLKKMSEKDFLNIVLYVKQDKIPELKKFVELYFPDKSFECIDVEFFKNPLARLYYDLKHLKVEAKENKQFLRKLFYQIVMLFLFPLKKIVSYFIRMSISDNWDCYFSPNFIVPEYITKLPVKKFVYVHDLIPIVLPDLHPDSAEDSWFIKTVRQYSSDWYYFTNSECTRKDLLKYCPQIVKDKVFTALLACDENFNPADDKMQQYVKNKYNIPMDKKYVFSLSTLEPRKNLIRAVKTFIEFINKNNIDDLVFVLGGGHWDMFIDKLNSEIENLGEYKDKIIKAGYVDDEDLAALYSGAQWFVYTSMYEGFWLPPLEAMASGCPVITSNNSSLPEVVGDAGLTVNPYSDEEHIMAYEKYYYDSNLRQENKIKGQERAKLFSWQKCTDIIVNQMFNAVSKE